MRFAGLLRPRLSVLERWSESRGRIPFRVRIGVTGHRQLVDEVALVEEIGRALAHVRNLFPASDETPVRFAVVSPLADGADRLVVRTVFAAFGTEEVELEAVLPLPRDDYSGEFDLVSRREFEHLLEDATTVTEIPTSASREEAYERAGRYVVDRSDVVLALWDGEPSRGRGGTAEIVAHAARSGVPLLVIPTHGDHDMIAQMRAEEDARDGRTRIERVAADFRRLDEYNREAISAERFQRAIEAEEERLLPGDEDSRIRATFEVLAGWALPYFVRADLLADKYQAKYYFRGDLVFLLAAAAVAVIAAQHIFWPETTELAAVEAVLMVLVMVLVWRGRRGRLHDRWIWYRSLAEAFRSALFIALTGLRDRREGVDRMELEAPADPWFQRAFTEAWQRRPKIELQQEDAGALRHLLGRAWLGGQTRYYRGSNRRYGRAHLILSRMIEALFISTLLFAVMHVFEVIDSLGDWFVFLSVAMPALGAAVAGIRDQRQFLLHAERYGRMADRLERLEERLKEARGLDDIRTVAAETQAVLLEENLDWFGVVEFQDLEMVV